MYRSACRHSGQAIILVAIFAVTLLVFLGLAVDSGMLYVERRHLQNTVDAACLAAATDMAMGETAATAQATALTYIDDNLDASARLAFDRGSLNAQVPLPSNGDIRVTVAVRSFSYFMRLAGIETYNVMARAHCGITAGGGLSPLAINRYPGYRNATTRETEGGVDPGQTLPQFYRRNKYWIVRDVLEGSDRAFGASGPEDAILNDGPLMANWATWTCNPPSYSNESNKRNWPGWPSVGDPGANPPTGMFGQACPPASESNPGPVIVIAGQGALPSSNDPQFTGPIHLDVRRISSGPDYYNGFPSGAALASEKDRIEQHIRNGYPGPAVHAGDELGVVPGVSAGIMIEALDDRYDVGHDISVLIYNGLVERASDFRLTVTCQAGQGPITTGGNKSCDNDGVNGGSFVHRTVPPDPPVSTSCKYSGNHYLADPSYTAFTGAGTWLQGGTGLYPATYIVKLEQASETMTVQLTARISSSNPGAGADFGPVAVRWKDSAGVPLKNALGVEIGWQLPNVPVGITLPANTTQQYQLEVIQTGATTATCGAVVPQRVAGAQTIQVNAEGSTGIRHNAYGTLGMYEPTASSGDDFLAADYFLSSNVNTSFSVVPGETIDAPLSFFNANAFVDDPINVPRLTFSALPAGTTELGVTPLMTGLTGEVVSNDLGSPVLRLSVPTTASPGWYTVDYQRNSSPVHSIRFHLLVTGPGNPSVDEWVTALCYATFRITDITSNAVKARAITGCEPLENAVTGWTSRLLPW